jgi:lipopolysaccharide transport system permease protein
MQTQDMNYPHDSQITIIKPSKGWVPLRLQELWEFRELLYFLVWRDIKVRYKQTVLGAAWAIIQPFFTMVVFSIFFGHLAKLPSDGLPYPVFIYTALLPWQLFAYAMTQANDSLVTNQNLIKKVYFPRLVIPLAAVLSGLVDFAIAFSVLLGMMMYYGIVLTAKAFTLPLFILFALITALAMGLWLSALNLKYRDVRYCVPFLVQLWLFATPVLYPSSLVPEPWRALYGLNPLAGVVEGFRWALLGRSGGMGPLMVVSILAVLVFLAGGLKYFQRAEKTFADRV